MGSRLFGVLLGRQAEGVPTHRVQDVFAPHAAEAADDVGRRIAFRMADMQTVARRVGKHVEDVEFLLTRGGIGGREGAAVFPLLLPFGFNPLRVIAGHGQFPLSRKKPNLGRGLG